MRRVWLRIGIAGILGFLAGALVTARLAQRASAVYLQVVLSTEASFERQRGVCARRRGDMEAAVSHYARLVWLESGANGFAADRLRGEWELGFPLLGLWSGEDPPNSDLTRVHALVDALNRALFAEALEGVGRVEAANAEYAEAGRLARLGGRSLTVDKAREHARDVMATNRLCSGDPPDGRAQTEASTTASAAASPARTQSGIPTPR